MGLPMNHSDRLGTRQRTRLLLAASFAALAASAFPQVWQGYPGTSYRTGASPVSVALGDFNGDGVTDFAAANEGTDDVSVLLGKGSSDIVGEAFAPAVQYPVDDAPTDIAVGDFNGDGISDLATANSGNYTVSVLLGKGAKGVGDGTFGPALRHAAGWRPLGVEAGDFNNDGVDDLASANSFANSVSVYLASQAEDTGGSIFAPRVDYATGKAPRDLTKGDFNADGISDLSIADSVGVSVLLGVGHDGGGDGTFAAPSSYPGDPSWSIVTGDFNADGSPDLATASWNADSISVRLGAGEGTFADATEYAAGRGPRNVVTADLNGDAVADLVASNRNSENLTVLLGSGSGGVGDGTFGPQTSVTSGYRPAAAAAADFNDDGVPDLLAISEGSPRAAVLAGAGDGTFISRADYAAGKQPRGMVTGDFNADGAVDLCIANFGSDSITVLLGSGEGGTGAGTFPTRADYAVGIEPWSLVTGHFNGDTAIDIGVTNFDSGSVSVLLGNTRGGIPDGTFAGQVSYSAGDWPTGLTTGDFNGDAITDFAATNLYSNTVSVMLGQGRGGTGDGTLALPVTYGTGSAPQHIESGDFNSDGVVDFVTANQDQAVSGVSVLIGRGDGTFDEHLTYTFGIGQGSCNVATGDFNSDGITDLASSASTDIRSVSLLLGNGSLGTGDGTFAPPVEIHIGHWPLGLAAGDFNGDGISDLAMADESADVATVLLGNGSGGIGDGTFAVPIAFAVGLRPRDLTASDLNGDGLVDLATANWAESTSVLLNLGFRDVTAPTSRASGPNGALSQPSPEFEVVYAASDTHLGSSGVAEIELYYQRNGDGYRSYGIFGTSPIRFDTARTGGDGTYDFYTVATDAAGNTEDKAPASEARVDFDNTQSSTLILF